MRMNSRSRSGSACADPKHGARGRHWQQARLHCEDTRCGACLLNATPLRPLLLLTGALMIGSYSAPGVASPGSRLWATGGVTTIEGSAGGGLTPWALLSG